MKARRQDGTRSDGVGAQEHYGENIGATDSHSIFIELKEPDPAGGAAIAEPLGPSAN